MFACDITVPCSRQVEGRHTWSNTLVSFICLEREKRVSMETRLNDVRVGFGVTLYLTVLILLRRSQLQKKKQATGGGGQGVNAPGWVSLSHLAAASSKLPDVLPLSTHIKPPRNHSQTAFFYLLLIQMDLWLIWTCKQPHRQGFKWL